MPTGEDDTKTADITLLCTNVYNNKPNNMATILPIMTARGCRKI